MQKRFAVAFTGPSNSGKTTLIVNVAQQLMKKYAKRVAIIKNDPKDKANFDVPGKDSYKFSQTGAEVVVTSPSRTTYFLKQHHTLAQMIANLDPFDYLLVEGLKNLPLPRISIFRNKIDTDYFGYMNALAIDGSIDALHYDIPEDVVLLDLNNYDDVIEWIFEHAKEIE